MYNPAWLQSRFSFDAAARHTALELDVFLKFADNELVTIGDLGAGSGANTRYYLDRIPQNQQWYGIEHDPFLCTIAIDEMINFGIKNNYSIQKNNDLEVVLKKNQRKIKVTMLCGSILDLENLLDLGSVDLLTANAVFDLFTVDQFTDLTKIIRAYRLPLLSTINYESMAFVPDLPEDAAIIGAYEDHMQRVQGFGQGMGPDCSREMQRILRTAGGRVKGADSHWHIQSEDHQMKAWLLGFIKESLLEMDFDSERLADWLKTADARGLVVKNQDVAAWF